MNALSASSDLIMVDIFLDNKPITCLCDTGAEINLIPAPFVRKHAMRIEEQPTTRPVMVDGTGVKCIGLTTATITIGKQVIPATFYIVEGVEIGILGLDALGKLQTKIDTTTGQVVMGDEEIVGHPKKVNSACIETARCCYLRLVESVTVNPGEERFLKAQLSGGSPTGWPAVVEATEHFQERTGLIACAVRVQPGETVVPICVTNIWDKPIKTYRGQTAAELIEIPNISEPVVASTYDNQQGEPQVEATYDPIAEVNIGNMLSAAQRQDLTALIKANTDIFECENNHGFTTTIEHNIPTTIPGPITCPPRRLPMGSVEAVNETIDKHLQKGHIEPSQSPWAFPIVPVKKKDGSIRLCVDYRPLNDITPSDPFPTSNMAECLDQLLGAKYFSTIDLAQGYLQVPMSLKDREKTAFRSPTGLWQWTRMPFGLKNAPATFSRLMRQVFNHIPPDRLVLYMDDLCVISFTFEEHLKGLREVFAALRQHNLKIKASKCSFGMPEASFLGHRITRDGVAPEPDKLTKLDNWQTLRNTKEVQRFLGFCGWWRRFIPNFASISKPLTRLLEKNVDDKHFTWTVEAQEAFEKLKHSISSAPLLRHPDPHKEFVVTTDASDVGIGGTLMQRDEQGALSPIAYFSRVLSKSERAYSTFDREALAIRDTLLHFRHYLLGVKFLLQTDHRPLLHLRNMKDPFGRRGRLLSDIAEFSFDIEHIEGKENVLADALSRLGFDKSIEDRSSDSSVAAVTANNSSDPAVPTTVLANWPDMRKAQNADPVVADVLEWVSAGVRPPYEAIQNKSYQIKAFWHKYGELVIHDGLLFRRPRDSGKFLQLVVPSAIVPKVLGELHSGEFAGHFGLSKMCNLITSRFYWPGFYGDAKEWCSRCQACAIRKMPSNRHCAPLQPVVVNSPGEFVATDLTKMPKSKKGNNYILVVQDYFTKYVDLYALPDQEALPVAQKLFTDYISKHGAPLTLHSDQGKQFECKVVKELNETFGIRKTRTSPYHPQSDGQVERFNRTLKDMVSKHTSNSGNEWDDHLQQLALAYNTSVHSSTGFTPFFLNHGREARLPIDLVYGPPPDNRQSPSKFVKDTVESLTKAFTTVRDNLSQAHKRQKDNYDTRVHHKPYKPGDRVWLHNPASLRQKLAPRWLGPFIVKKRLESKGSPGVNYRIQEETGRRRRVVHYNRLKACSVPPSSERTKEDANPTIQTPPTVTLSEPPQQPATVNGTDSDDEQGAGSAVAEQGLPQIVDIPRVTRTGRAVRPPERYGF